MQIFEQYYFFVHTDSVKEKYRNWPPRQKSHNTDRVSFFFMNLSSARSPGLKNLIEWNLKNGTEELGLLM